MYYALVPYNKIIPTPTKYLFEMRSTECLQRKTVGVLSYRTTQSDVAVCVLLILAAKKIHTILAD